MSRSHPKKRKKRSARKTILIYCEGLAEEAFVKYLKRIYSFESNTATNVKKGKGGTADGIVVDAFRTPGEFDEKIVILDNDKPQDEMIRARQIAKNNRIYLVENEPCLESLLLSVLCKGRSFDEKNSQWCKKEFESKYLDAKKRGNIDHYGKLFPKDLLERMRKKLKTLNALICLIQNQRPV